MISLEPCLYYFIGDMYVYIEDVHIGYGALSYSGNFVCRINAKHNGSVVPCM